MGPYLTLIITALLGILGVISKTKIEKEKDPPRKKKKAESEPEKKDNLLSLINKPTIFGIGVLILLVSSLATGIITQISKDNQSQADKLKAAHDAARLNDQFRLDSMGHELTITKLENQLQRDSLGRITDSSRFRTTKENFQEQIKTQRKIIQDDSARFNITLKNFGNQLNYQEKTLGNIQEVLHPLLPIKITVKFYIDLSKLNRQASELIKAQMLYLKRFVDKKPPKGFKITDPDPKSFAFLYQGRYIDYDTIKTEDTTLTKFNQFVYHRLIPAINFYFYRIDTLKDVSAKNANLVLGTAYDVQNYTSCNLYYAFLSEKFLSLYMTYDNLDLQKNDGTINSILSIKSGAIAVHPVYLLKEWKDEQKLTMHTIIIECGTNYPQKYELFMPEASKNIFAEKDSVYIIEGKNLLKSLERNRL